MARLTHGANAVPPPSEPGVTTGAVARRLGVSPTTLRSWDRRYGIGPATRQDGRHRRWSPKDIAMLNEMCRLTAEGVPPAEAARAARASFADAPQDTDSPDSGPLTGGASADSPPAGASPIPPPRGPEASRQAVLLAHVVPDVGPVGSLPLGDVRLECRGLARAAVRLDAPAVDSLLRSFVEEHGLTAAWEEVMVPTLHAVGRKWEAAGDQHVDVEHLLSWHISSALRRPPAAHPVASGARPTLLACMPHEQHTLALEALAATLTEAGAPVRMFGGAVPVEALEAAVRRIGPASVVLWSQARSTASRPLARHIAAGGWGVKGARTYPAVLLAGPGWAGPTVPGTLRPFGLRDALATVTRLCGISD